MTSKRFNQLPKTNELNSEAIDKLLPLVKKTVRQNLMNQLI